MKNLYVIFAFILLFLCTTEALAEGLKFSPQRINFDAKDRVFTLTVLNDSDEKKAYRLSFETRYLKPEGGTTLVSDESEFSAVPYLRLSPRRIILGANQRQKVRLQYTGSNLVDGDYLAHLKFTEVNLPSDLQSDEESVGMKFEVKQVVNVAIPLRLSVGDVQSNVKIISAEKSNYAQDGYEFWDITFKRSGNGNGSGFLYGRFKKDGSDEQGALIIQRVPVNIYRNTDKFTLKAPLVAGAKLGKGTLMLTLYDGEGINRPVIDTLVLNIPE